MIDAAQIFSLNFFSYGGVYTGEHRGMRYRLAGEGKEPERFFTVCVWPEPFCYESTPEEEKMRVRFPFSEEGRLRAVDWLREQYDQSREIWERAADLRLSSWLLDHPDGTENGET